MTVHWDLQNYTIHTQKLEGLNLNGKYYDKNDRLKCKRKTEQNDSISMGNIHSRLFMQIHTGIYHIILLVFAAIAQCDNHKQYESQKSPMHTVSFEWEWITQMSIQLLFSVDLFDKNASSIISKTVVR